MVSKNMSYTAHIPRLKNQGAGNFFLIAGPCAIEDEKMALTIAEAVNRICTDLSIPYIFKGSYRKANRSRLDSFTGIGDEKAFADFAESGRNF
jgi:2-dehydro-3-deoxyphosphooctonate aldolase (KDO 8-P synthase)